MEVEDTPEANINLEESSKEKETDVEQPESSENEKTEEKNENDDEEKNKKMSFKMPLIIGAIKKGTVPHKFKPSKEEEGPQAPPIKKSSTIPALQIYADPNKSKEKLIPLPYTEPEWGGNISDDDYILEVLKDGVIVEKLQLNTKSFYIFGRLSNCDVQMNHPSSSRYHAILQYRLNPTEKSPKGFYIYDLGSTHGTFLNKNRIKSKVYAPIKVGQFFKIGGSSRMLILQGPSEDEEPESELSVTELKKQKIQKEKEAELEKIRLEKEAEVAEEKRKEEIDKAGIDWGMGEDADEETDLTENPFAATTNEELYVSDPKKSLRGWYEREGHELVYDCTEKSMGQFFCRVILPVDDSHGRPLIAEALVRGKKKEAVVQCAMEACRILDRQGLLRQATHEGKQRKKKDWADDDFYDSDEDTFLDRTGSVEIKRERRMLAAGKVEAKAETYESLVKQLEDVRKEIKDAEALLAINDAKQEEIKAKNESEDALDEFMSSLKHDNAFENKHKRRAAKAQIANLQQKEIKLRKLANLARPASLPELIAPVAEPVKKLPVMIGARPSAKPRALPKTLVPVATVTSMEVEEEDESSDEEIPSVAKVPRNSDPELKNKISEIKPEKTETSSKSPVISEKLSPKSSTSMEVSGTSEESPKTSGTKVELKIKEKKLCPSIPEEFLRELRGEVGEEKQTRKRSRNRPSSQQKEKASGSLDEERPDYSTWVPPKDQSGDGRTKLNEKYGY